MIITHTQPKYSSRIACTCQVLRKDGDCINYASEDSTSIEDNVSILNVFKPLPIKSSNDGVELVACLQSLIAMA